MSEATVKKTRSNKPKTSIEAVPQLATLPERVSVLEVRVQNIEEKIDDVKIDITGMHENLAEKLTQMQAASTHQHAELANKINDLEKFRNKWVRIALVVLAFAAGAGWVNSTNIPQILQLLTPP